MCKFWQGGRAEPGGRRPGSGASSVGRRTRGGEWKADDIFWVTHMWGALSRSFLLLLYWILTSAPWVRACSPAIFQMRRLVLREFIWPAEGHTARKCWGQDSNLSLFEDPARTFWSLLGAPTHSLLYLGATGLLTANVETSKLYLGEEKGGGGLPYFSWWKLGQGNAKSQGESGRESLGTREFMFPKSWNTLWPLK